MEHSEKTPPDTVSMEDFDRLSADYLRLETRVLNLEKHVQFFSDVFSIALLASLFYVFSPYLLKYLGGAEKEIPGVET